MVKRILFCMILFPYAIYADAQADIAYLNLEKKDELARLEIHVSQFRYWSTRRNPTEVALLLLPPQNRDDGDASDKFMALYKNLTGEDYIYAGDKPKSPHQGIYVRVTWRDSAGHILRQKIAYSDYGSGKVMCRPGKSFPLDDMALLPGDYSVSVESITNDSRFGGDIKTAICSGYLVK